MLYFVMIIIIIILVRDGLPERERETVSGAMFVEELVNDDQADNCVVVFKYATHECFKTHRVHG